MRQGSTHRQPGEPRQQQDKKRTLPNLQRVHAIVGGRRVHVRVCTRCLKAGKVVKAA